LPRLEPAQRLALVALAGLFTAFATYGSWVPLEVHAVPLDMAIDRFLRTPLVPLRRASRTDFITNVLLFIPIGFFVSGALDRASRALNAVLAAPVIVLCFALSVAIEFGQIFVSGRTPSWNDVHAETIGGGIGAFAWTVGGRFAFEWVAGLWNAHSGRDVLWRLLGLYTAVWLLLAVLPFDFTIRPPELAHKFRQGRIVLVPFGGPARLADHLGVLLMALPIGAFGFLLGARRRSEWPVAFALLFGGLLACFAEGAQLFALSRTADATDLLLTVAGAGLGALAIARVLEQPLKTGGLRIWPTVALGVWCLVLAVRHWSPFDFVFSRELFDRRLPIMLHVPFESYYWGMPLNSLAEALTKVLLAIPVGMLLQLAWLPQTRAGRGWQLPVFVVISAGIFLVVELGQVLLPTRVPDQTDIYIGIGGALVGVLFIRLVARRPAADAEASGQSL
jgi:glycopeptide antibiotics resistance protein